MAPWICTYFIAVIGLHEVAAVVEETAPCFSGVVWWPLPACVGEAFSSHSKVCAVRVVAGAAPFACGIYSTVYIIQSLEGVYNPT